jgi:hypothetical protein
MNVSFRQTTVYPFLAISYTPGDDEVSYNVSKDLVDAYEASITAMHEAELALLLAAKDDIEELANSVPHVKDRQARNRRARAIQLKERMRLLQSEME